MSIENNYDYKGRQYLKLTFSSDDDLEKYQKNIIRSRDSIPRGISFHRSDDTGISGLPFALLEPNWIHFHDWVKTLDLCSFWTKKTQKSNYLGNITPPHYFSSKVRAVLRDIMDGIIKSHNGGLYSGLLTPSNIENGTTGIFVSGGEAVIVCYNKIRERLPAWGNIPTVTGASTSTFIGPPLLDLSDEISRREQDLIGFKILVDYLVQKFKDASIQIPVDIEMLDKLYTYLPNFKTLFDIEKFQIYVKHAPLLWSKSQRLKFCHLMYAVRKKSFGTSIDYTRLIGWQNVIQKRGQGDRLYHIYNYGNNGTTYRIGGDDMIILFIRNAMVHLCHKNNTTVAFSNQEALEIIHDYYPHWLPILYTSFIRALGFHSAPSQNQPIRTFHDLFMEEFDA